MKRLCKIVLALLCAAVLCATVSFTASAVSGAAGETVTVSFPFSKAYGVDGYLTFDNVGMFESVKPGKKIITEEGEISGSFSCTTDTASVFGLSKQVSALDEPGAQVAVMLYGADAPTDFEVTLTCKIKEGIPGGSKCNIVFKYEVNVSADGDMDNNGGSWYYVSQSVEVGKSSSTAGRVGVDYSGLKKQLSVADGLNSDEYSAETWSTFSGALEAARSAKSNGTQEEVDAAEQALKAAMDGLVKVDYSKLTAAISETENYAQETTVGTCWSEMLAALEQGRSALESRDQATVDAAADRLSKALNDVRDYLATLSGSNAGGKSQAADTNTPHCNIPLHTLWQILLIISAVLNVGFTALIVWYIRRRKIEQAAEVPLVDYNIEDDDDLYAGIEFPTAPPAAEKDASSDHE